jgi:hypothetical protein
MFWLGGIIGFTLGEITVFVLLLWLNWPEEN